MEKQFLSGPANVDSSSPVSGVTCRLMLEVCGVFTQILLILKKEVSGEGGGSSQGRKICLHDSCVIIERTNSGTSDDSVHVYAQM